MRSIRLSASVIKKVYVPKYIYPLSNVLANFVTFCISLSVLVCFIVFFVATGKNPPHITGYIFLAPVPILILLVLSIGVGMILSTLEVFFKDVDYLYEVFCLLLFYLTPIFYKLKSLNISNKWFLMFIKANPLYSICEMFRCCVLYGRMFSMHQFLYALGFSVASVLIGVLLFYKKQDKFILHL
jgi:ABC-type polysaccharide/polyol phosphate export permease